jgi:hypothetical protein
VSKAIIMGVKICDNFRTDAELAIPTLIKLEGVTSQPIGSSWRACMYGMR